MSNKERLGMDNLFKALLIIILVAFLYLYYEKSNNDRYSYHRLGTKGREVFDKKTGTFYHKTTTGFVSRNYINGTVIYIKEDIK